MYMRPVVTDRLVWSVSLSVTVVSPAKTADTDRDGVWVEDLGGPKEPCIRWGFRSPMGMGNFKGERGGPLYTMLKYSHNNYSHSVNIQVQHYK